MPHEEGVINLLSVGRFTHPKNYDNVPAILKNVPAPVKWYLIGYGGEEPLIRQRIAVEGMEGKVIVLGKKENPYPYIKACDIYVQPSRYEGNAVTVREAQMLGKPVVVTNYPTAASQITDGIDGIIVPIDNKECADGIADFLQDKQLQCSIIDYLKINDYSNVVEVEKIDKLLS